MIGRNEIFYVRQEISNYIGSKVRIRAHKGRKKTVVREGVIENTYPSIFAIKLQDKRCKAERIVSFSYTDVLTHTVELVLCEEPQ